MAIDASHETIEMLIDPYGNRLQASTAMWISNGQLCDLRTIQGRMPRTGPRP
jgi:hypothetical protein